MSLLQNSNAISAGGYSVDNSLRFRASASARLSRTFSSTGTNNKIQTFSAWVKRGLLSSSTTYRLMGGYDGSSSNSTEINFNNDTLRIEFGGAASNSLITTQVFRDPSAWYHIVIAIDTTQATSSNRIKMYVNGSQVTAFGTANYPSQNATSQLTSANANNSIGAGWSGFEYFDGYMAEVNFIDGSAKAASDFGETDSTTGVWKPKAYTGTYGTNGFYLKFSDIATTSGSNAGLGKDFSGNANYWTTNNISVTSGTTYDAMIDVPTNTSATVANYAVMNPLYKDAGLGAATFSNANLKTTATSAGFAISTIGVTSGKWYWEFTADTVANSTENNVGVTAIPFGSGSNFRAYGANGQYFNGSSWASYGATYTNGDIIGVALDMDAQTLTFYKNNSSQGQKTSIGLTGLEIFSCCYENTTNASFSANFGQRPFAYTPPTGFVALNTFNLPTPTILQGNQYMDATVYSGNSTSGRLITNAALFQPDFVWVKNRTLAGRNHQLFDSVRGANKGLFSNLTNAESTTTQDITAFNSNGFTVGNDNNVNSTGDNFVGWQWQAGQGTTSSNTSGSITSTVSVSTTAGFSVVTYTGTGTSGATVGHGLGAKPKIVFYKRRNSTSDWLCLQDIQGSMKYGYLNTTAAFGAAGETAPTSSVLYLSAGSDSNASGGTYVAYCFAAISGYSAFGSYTGNGSADGPFIYLGFRPKFVITKVYSTSGYNWNMYDSSRGTYNAADQVLVANGSGAEETGFDPIDFLSNGFKLRMGNRGSNVSGASYIYMAFAENPFSSNNRAR